MDARWARPFFAVTAACVFVGVVVQLIVSANDATAFGAAQPGVR